MPDLSRFCVLLPEPLITKARLVADARGVSVGELIRQGLANQCRPTATPPPIDPTNPEAKS